MPGDAAAIIARLADPAIRIVSLTITEGGYFIDPASGVFNPTHPDIVADAADLGAPKTVFGLILAGLMRAPRRRHRRRSPSCPATTSPTTAMSPRTPSSAWRGSSTRISPTGSSENVAFPNGMVDRITPATTDRERAILRERVRRRGQLAGVLRAVQAMGAGGQFHRRPAGAGKGRRAVRQGRRALRTDEDPHPQRRPCDDRLSGRADGHPFRP